MKISIDSVRCDGCGCCLAVCPTSAIQIKSARVVVNHDKCTVCHNCLVSCPLGAITLYEE
jgi:ferredoxin